MSSSRGHTAVRWAVLVLAVGLLLALPSSGARPSWQAPAPATDLYTSVWRVLLAAPLIVHGLAHLSGAAAPFTTRLLGFADQPWVLSTGRTLHSAPARAFSVAWLAAALGLVGAGAGLLTGQAWWPGMALAAAGLSLAVIVIWWKAVPPGAKVGAAFDVLILLTALQPAAMAMG